MSCKYGIGPCEAGIVRCDKCEIASLRAQLALERINSGAMSERITELKTELYVIIEWRKFCDFCGLPIKEPGCSEFSCSMVVAHRGLSTTIRQDCRRAEHECDSLRAQLAERENKIRELEAELAAYRAREAEARASVEEVIEMQEEKT